MTSSHLTRSRAARIRSRGAATMLVLVCLIFITLVMGAWLRQFHLGLRSQRQRSYQAQARVLAESAIERAVFRFERDTSYSGERWVLDPETLGLRQAAEVTISMLPQSEVSTGTQEVSVVARYPVDSKLETRVSRTVVIDLSPHKGTSSND